MKKQIRYSLAIVMCLAITYGGSAFAATGDIRFDLSWGNADADLDAHLQGPDENGGPFRVFFGVKTSPDGRAVWSSDDPLGASSEETVTVMQKDGHYTPGTYYYWICKNSFFDDPADFVYIPDTILVEVRQGDTLLGSFPQEPPKIYEQQNLWQVLKMIVSDDGGITLVPVRKTLPDTECHESDTGTIDIAGVTGGCGEPVVAPIRIQNAPNAVTALGFDVVFDPEILVFQGFEKGPLVPEGWEFDVNFISPNIIRCGGHMNGTPQIPQGASGDAIRLKFDTVSDCLSVQIGLENLKDDIAAWAASPGCFSRRPVACGGDTNEDGDITPADALAVFEKYMLICPTSGGLDCNVVCCDTNADGNCTPADALCVFNAYLERPNCLDSVSNFFGWEFVSERRLPNPDTSTLCMGEPYTYPQTSYNGNDGDVWLPTIFQVPDTNFIGELCVEFQDLDEYAAVAEGIYDYVEIEDCGVPGSSNALQIFIDIEGIIQPADVSIPVRAHVSGADSEPVMNQLVEFSLLDSEGGVSRSLGIVATNTDGWAETLFSPSPYERFGLTMIKASIVGSEPQTASVGPTFCWWAKWAN